MGYSVISDYNITTYIDPEGNDVSQPLNVSIGVGSYQRLAQLHVGNMETKYGNTANNYNKGEITLSYTAENNWIKIGKDPENTNSTAAAIVYTSQKNEGDNDRQVELTLSGNTDNKITIIQKPIVRLLYMIKTTNGQYGDWIECMKINRGSKISHNQSPLTSVKDISIFNGKSNNTYNDIIVELQPYRSMDVSFGFSQDDTIDRLITSKYTLSTIQDSTFITSKQYNTNTGYFSFSTNDQNSWNGNTLINGQGIITDVSSHYLIKPNTGVNLPNIHLYISNMLNYTIITKYNLKITCTTAGTCFIQSVKLDNTSYTWPTARNAYVIIENVRTGGNTSILLIYPSTGITINNNLFNMTYEVSISGYTYIDDSGTEHTSTASIPVSVGSDTNILSIKKSYDEGMNTAYIHFKSYKNENNQRFVKDNWPPNWSEYLVNWEDDEMGGRMGIDIKLPNNQYRFRTDQGLSQNIIIPLGLTI